MKNIYLTLTFLLLTVSMTFANNITSADVLDNAECTIELVGENQIIDFEIVAYDFDICTITVTVRSSGGSTYSATASNNAGDCNAAYTAARDHAFLLAAVFG